MVTVQLPDIYREISRQCGKTEVSTYSHSASGNKQEAEKEPDHWFYHHILTSGMCRVIYKEITRFRGKVTIQRYYL